MKKYYWFIALIATTLSCTNSKKVYDIQKYVDDKAFNDMNGIKGVIAQLFCCPCVTALLCYEQCGGRCYCCQKILAPHTIPVGNRDDQMMS